MDNRTLPEGVGGAVNQRLIKILLAATFLIFFAVMGLFLFQGKPVQHQTSSSSSYLDDGTAVQSDTIKTPGLQQKEAQRSQESASRTQENWQ